jgi:hypothetical protein
MPRLRGNPARDLCPTQIGNVSNLSLQGLSQFVQVGAQLRHGEAEARQANGLDLVSGNVCAISNTGRAGLVMRLT